MIQVAAKKVNDDHYWLSLPNELIIGALIHTFGDKWMWFLLYPTHASGLADSREEAAATITDLYQKEFL